MAIVKIDIDVTAEQAVAVAEVLREVGHSSAAGVVMAPFMTGVPEACALFSWAQGQVVRSIQGDTPDTWVVVKTHVSGWGGNEQNGGRDYYKTYATTSPWGEVEVKSWHCDYWVPNDRPTGSFTVRCGEVEVYAADEEWLRNYHS